MEQRLKNLENLSELLTKEMVQSTIEANKNLLIEIKSLRDSFVKQNVRYFINFFFTIIYIS